MAKSLLEKLKDTTELKQKHTVFDEAHKLVGIGNKRNKNQQLSHQEYYEIFGYFPEDYFDSIENRVF